MSVIIKASYYFALAVALHFLINLKNKYVDAIVLDDIDIDYINSDYVNLSNFQASVKFKRKSVNTLNLKLQYVRDLPDDTYITGDVSTRAFGYEMPSGLKFRSSLCNSVEGKALFNIIATPMGVKECPIKKGLYQRENLELDFSKLPVPALPGGARLQLKVGMYGDGDTAIGTFRVFILT